MCVFLWFAGQSWQPVSALISLQPKPRRTSRAKEVAAFGAKITVDLDVSQEGWCLPKGTDPSLS